ncbi:hypothetical protein [Bacillus atrophaeus]|uniref:hypothetical protein n=1 Tax=Bacillus atrophaeus TaxID=1452 RepID=UPI0021633456|nr:hypothetical protein [Bacillus atrophaeus]MCY8517900.1 hypothetical protein [Bacillus atrophaeus]MCY8807570.1 hypothetical protein [Bacillus atrophaeus]MCY8946271.1 hypothetical protein [Bacillus atrophaeus]
MKKKTIIISALTLSFSAFLISSITLGYTLLNTKKISDPPVGTYKSTELADPPVGTSYTLPNKETKKTEKKIFY